MPFIELIRLSFTAVITNKLRSFLTALGIIIGVFSVITLISLSNGLQTYITGQVSGLGSNLIFVIPGQFSARGPGGVTSNKLTSTDATLIKEKLSGEAKVISGFQQAVTIKYKNKVAKTVTLRATEYNYPEVFHITLPEGTFFTQAQERSGLKVTLIGLTVKKNLFDNEDPIGKQIKVGSGLYTIIGVVGPRGSTFGIDQDNYIYVPFSSAKRQFNITNISSITISVKNAADIDQVKKIITTQLTKRLSADDFTVQGQEDTLSTLNNITNALTAALGGIAAISLLVGGIGVANIMLVSVTERTQEIGLRKALGAQKEDILKQFLLEAVMLCVTGGTIGILLGFLAAWGISQFFTTTVTPWSILLAFGFSVGVGIIFGMAPAIKASNLNPIEALRYE